MLEQMIRALAEKVSAVLDAAPRQTLSFRITGVDIDIGMEQQQEVEDFYIRVAVPRMAALASIIGNRPVVFGSFEKNRSVTVFAQRGIAMRLMVARDLMTNRILGRFDVMYAPLSAAA